MDELETICQLSLGESNLTVKKLPKNKNNYGIHYVVNKDKEELGEPIVEIPRDNKLVHWEQFAPIGIVISEEDKKAVAEIHARILEDLIKNEGVNGEYLVRNQFFGCTKTGGMSLKEIGFEPGNFPLRNYLLQVMESSKKYGFEFSMPEMFTQFAEKIKSAKSAEIKEGLKICRTDGMDNIGQQIYGRSLFYSFNGTLCGLVDINIDSNRKTVEIERFAPTGFLLEDERRDNFSLMAIYSMVNYVIEELREHDKEVAKKEPSKKGDSLFGKGYSITHKIGAENLETLGFREEKLTAPQFLGRLYRVAQKEGLELEKIELAM
jgi:hypothetical protein